MKKSKIIHLALITAALASCNKQKGTNERRVFMRTDSTASYSRAHGCSHWYYAFRPYGVYDGRYNRAGYYSSAISEKSNYGTNPLKNSISRGGFGRSSYHVSS